MSYQFSPKKQPLPPLSVAKEIIELSNDIKKNIQHRGRNFEIVKQGYEELKKANGLPPSSKRLCRSGCITQMNKMMTNWINRFEEGGGIIPSNPSVTILTPKVQSAPSSNPLIPLEDKRKALEEKSWAELNKLVIEKRKGIPMETNGRASKVALINELLK